MDTPICLPNIKISEDDLMCVIKRDGKTVIIDQTVRIAELESKIAALKKITEEERAAMLACAEDLHGIDDGHLIEARRQLAEEHPEVDWK